MNTRDGEPILSTFETMFLTDSAILLALSITLDPIDARPLKNPSIALYPALYSLDARLPTASAISPGRDLAYPTALDTRSAKYLTNVEATDANPLKIAPTALMTVRIGAVSLLNQEMIALTMSGTMECPTRVS